MLKKTCVLFLNSVVVTSNPSLSQKADNFNKAQDIMEALSGKVNFTDETFLSEISNILSDRWDKNKAIKEVFELTKSKFEELGLKDNYKFVEVNELNGATLLSSGNYDSAENISIAIFHLKWSKTASFSFKSLRTWRETSGDIREIEKQKERHCLSEKGSL